MRQRAEETYLFAKIRGAIAIVVNYLTNRIADGIYGWDIRTLASAKTITLLKGREDQIKGIAITVVNTGWWTSFLERLGGPTFATSRAHRIASGEAKCST